MNWGKVLKSSKRRKENNSEAYNQKFLTQYSENKPQEIIEGEVKRKISVISEIADQGIEEKSRLKAAISWLRFSRQLSEVSKIEIEGSLTLEARLTEALEKAEAEVVVEEEAILDNMSK